MSDRNTDDRNRDAGRPENTGARRRRVLLTAGILFAAAFLIYAVFVASGMLRAAS